MAANISSPPVPSTRANHCFPSHVTQRPTSVPTNVAAKLHRSHPAELAKDEEVWRDRYSFFLTRGLELRFRYRPGWLPSWIGTSLDPTTCEDSIRKPIFSVLDAIRHKDGALVCIKRIEREWITDEVKIGTYLSTEQMLRDPTNHCVPILDSFRDPILPKVEYIVMPILRPYNDPEFHFIGEVVDFASQILEGLNFMHSHLIAHGDLTGQNIMMDARPILPQGWHFALDYCAPNGLDPIAPLTRIDYPVRYFIIDYDCSKHFSPGESHLVRDFGGGDSDPPELTKDHPYDAFKVDVFTLGNIFYKDFYQMYDGLEFLKGQIDYMRTPDFRRRPTAHVALQSWLETKAKLDVSVARWRLSKRDENVGLRVMRDAVSVVQRSFGDVTRMLNPQQQARVRTWSNP